MAVKPVGACLTKNVRFSLPVQRGLLCLSPADVCLVRVDFAAVFQWIGWVLIG